MRKKMACITIDDDGPLGSDNDSVNSDDVAEWTRPDDDDFALEGTH